MGKLIVVEGACDGIGKSTQYTLLKERLIKDGNNVVSHHFPSYGEYQGVPVEKYLKGEFGNIEDLSPYFINNLYAVDRAITWHSYLKKEYQNSIILLDRYTTSSLIYQSTLIDDIEKRKEFIDYVISFEYEKLGIKEPDLVIFLEAPYDLVKKLRNERKVNDGIQNDIHEKNDEFMRKVYENALFVADYLKFSKIKCNDGDHMRSIEDIHNDIYKLIKK
ncbi:thymidylate kinase [Firmicutes bacterium CAG:884]|nr:thymidylate kinase [Firmicutes bacterium CAG:884]